MESFNVGFLKRAAELGYNEDAANGLLKLARAARHAESDPNFLRGFQTQLEKLAQIQPGDTRGMWERALGRAPGDTAPGPVWRGANGNFIAGQSGTSGPTALTTRRPVTNIPASAITTIPRSPASDVGSAATSAATGAGTAKGMSLLPAVVGGKGTAGATAATTAKAGLGGKILAGAGALGTKALGVAASPLVAIPAAAGGLVLGGRQIARTGRRMLQGELGTARWFQNASPEERKRYEEAKQQADWYKQMQQRSGQRAAGTGNRLWRGSRQTDPTDVEFHMHRSQKARDRVAEGYAAYLKHRGIDAPRPGAGSGAGSGGSAALPDMWTPEAIKLYEDIKASNGQGYTPEQWRWFEGMSNQLRERKAFMRRYEPPAQPRQRHYRSTSQALRDREYFH